VLIPDNFFQEYRFSGLIGMLVILVASIPLYICATSSVPIAAVLLMKGLSPGALLVFLMAGPATNAATMTVVGQNMGRKTLIIYLTALIIGSIAFGLVIDYLLPGNWFLPIMDMSGGHAHGFLPQWLTVGSAILLIALLINTFIKQYRDNRAIKKAASETPQFSLNIPEVIISVEGMTCNHCKAKVENGLRNQAGIRNAIADIEQNTVKLYGENIERQKLGSLLQELGYDFKGELT
jgi:uncharacterized membrane protein YraQ (UPF0718 family)